MSFEISNAEVALFSTRIARYAVAAGREIGVELIGQAFHVARRAADTGAKAVTFAAPKGSSEAFWNINNPAAVKRVAIRWRMTRRTPRALLEKRIARAAKAGERSLGFLRAAWGGSMSALRATGHLRSNARSVERRSKFKVAQDYGSASAMPFAANPEVQFWNAIGGHKRKHGRTSGREGAAAKFVAPGLRAAISTQSSGLEKRLDEALSGATRKAGLA